jgi:uncharacterized membrane protein
MTEAATVTERRLDHFLRIAGDITATSVGGAMLGTAVEPIVGTIIGAVAGALVSSLIARREIARP